MNKNARSTNRSPVSVVLADSVMQYFDIQINEMVHVHERPEIFLDDLIALMSKIKKRANLFV